jgi:hypothetical protein
MNKQLIDYLLDSFADGITCWQKTHLETMFGKNAVEAAIQQSHLVKTEAGEILLAFQVPGTVEFELSKLLPPKQIDNDLIALLAYLARQDRLLATLEFLHGFRI